MANEPHFVHLADALIDVGPIADLGPTPEGRRRLITINGGTVRGPRLNGRILPGGTDYQIVREDGVIELEARYVIETDDGEAIYVVNRGVRDAPPGVQARMSKGEAVDPALVYFRTTPRFMTAAAKLQWITRRIFVGMAARHPDRVEIGFYELT